MNSLEFIKMHVDEWPAQHWNTAFLRLDGVLWFFSGTAEFSMDLSEHFAPDYYDGAMWTREDFESCGSNSSEPPNTWAPTINSIVDVGDCEGVVKAIDGEHYWVLKDTGMYDTYHKDSLKQPTREDIRAVMDATWFTQDAAEILVDKLDIVGYKIVRKGESI